MEKQLIAKGSFGAEYDKSSKPKFEIEFELNKCKKDNARDTDLNTISEYYTFSAMGGKWHNNRKDYEYCGQCLDEQELLNAFEGNEQALRIVQIWREYHLNDISAGTRTQMDALEKWKSQGNKATYDKECTYLKSINLLIDNGYKYGRSWLICIIPPEIIQEIKAIASKINSD